MATLSTLNNHYDSACLCLAPLSVSHLFVPCNQDKFLVCGKILINKSICHGVSSERCFCTWTFSLRYFQSMSQYLKTELLDHGNTPGTVSHNDILNIGVLYSKLRGSRLPFMHDCVIESSVFSTLVFFGVIKPCRRGGVHSWWITPDIWLFWWNPKHIEMFSWCLTNINMSTITGSVRSTSRRVEKTIPPLGSWTGSCNTPLWSNVSDLSVEGIQTWQNFILLGPLLIICGAEEAGCGAGEAVVRQLGVLLSDDQSLEETAGRLLIVLHCDLK